MNNEISSLWPHAKNRSYLSLEDLEFLDDSVVHAQLGVAHQHAVPVFAADTVRQVAQVLKLRAHERKTQKLH